MVLYRSHELTDLHIEVSAKFTALRLNFIALPPSGHVFLMHHDSLNWILIQGHQGNIFAKFYWKLYSGFWQEDF